MNTILIGSLVVLIVILALTVIVFRPGKDFNPEREREQAAPLNSDGPVMLRYPGGPQDENEPVQDVLHMHGDASGGPPPLPSDVTTTPRDMLQRIGPAGKPGAPPNAIPLPKTGPVVHKLDNHAVKPGAQDEVVRRQRDPDNQS